MQNCKSCIIRTKKTEVWTCKHLPHTHISPNMIYIYNPNTTRSNFKHVTQVNCYKRGDHVKLERDVGLFGAQEWDLVNKKGCHFCFSSSSRTAQIFCRSFAMKLKKRPNLHHLDFNEKIKINRQGNLFNNQCTIIKELLCLRPRNAFTCYGKGSARVTA